jgi:cholesterol oxidase
MTAAPVEVAGGRLHLLAPVDGGPARTMTYVLPFVGDDGRSWLLYGVKHVRRGWDTDPWRATTRLNVALTSPDERYEGIVPTGRMTISVRDVLRLLASIRPTGTPAAHAHPSTIVRFAWFFTDRVARAFVARSGRS